MKQSLITLSRFSTIVILVTLILVLPFNKGQAEINPLGNNQHILTKYQEEIVEKSSDTLSQQMEVAKSASVVIADQQAKLVADDAETIDYFGEHVAVEGDTAVIGAQGEDPDLGGGPINNAGSAYVFVRNGITWNQQTKLVASDASEGAGFGYSVAITGDTVVIGADTDLSAGAVYIFTRSGIDWSEDIKLGADDLEESDRFGSSVDIDGDTVIVGAYNEDPDLGSGPIGDAGSAYVFTWNGSEWSQQAKLFADDADVDDRFGWSVSISGDYAVIGTINANSAYVYKRNGTTWSQQDILIPDDPENRYMFGTSVSIDGDTAIIGDSSGLSGDPPIDAGSAYIFTRIDTDWTQEAKLIADGADAGDGFGGSVAIEGDRAIVGAANTPDGSGYSFTGDGSTWSQESKMIADDAQGGDEFGCSVAISGDTVVLGADHEDPDLGGGPIDGAGSTYVFVISEKTEANTDFDGDGISDIGFFRALALGLWGILKSTMAFDFNEAQWFNWGQDGDVPVLGDYDGDGKADPTIRRPPEVFQSAALLALLSSTGYDYGQYLTIPAGWPSLGDTPVPADFDGDAMTDPAIWRESQGVWIITLSGGNYSTYQFASWGMSGDSPVGADVDGDEKADIGFYRASSGLWGFLKSSTGYSLDDPMWFSWGGPTDTPMMADYDGDGLADPAFVTPPAGGQSAAYRILLSSTGYDYNHALTIPAGWPSLGDTPIPADFDGDGKVDPGIWRESIGAWIIAKSSCSYSCYQFAL